ncbi:cuticle protein 18.7-like [Atheta coriaria]|uniref:cuticle protein 18.7-like n=1 Tax=Dalotia coriaria TaxID=877792 RepID=UPI0031F3D081
MKFFIVFACALAAASAGFVAPVAYGAQHLPVIGPNGVPVDTPAVQQATAAHLTHKAEAYARNGDYAYAPHAYAYAAPFAYAHHAVAAPIVAAHVGVAETPEVVAAKQAHFAAHAEALARVAPVHHLARRGVYAAAPVVAAYAAPVAYAAQHLPVIGPNGVPVDTPAVQQARAAHFSHKVEAHARNGDYLAHPVAAAAYGAYPYAYGAYPYSYGAYGAYAKYY